MTGNQLEVILQTCVEFNQTADVNDIALRVFDTWLWKRTNNSTLHSYPLANWHTYLELLEACTLTAQCRIGYSKSELSVCYLPTFDHIYWCYFNITRNLSSLFDPGSLKFTVVSEIIRMLQSRVETYFLADRLRQIAYIPGDRSALERRISAQLDLGVEKLYKALMCSLKDRKKVLFEVHGSINITNPIS